MDVAGYLDRLSEIYATGAATEHSYRPALEALFKSIDDTAEVINEPKKSEGGMPDFLFQRDNVPFGWCEAKDIDKDIIKLKGYSVAQRKRYEAAYPNLIYTNGVDFEFIRDGEQAYLVSIADFMGQLGGLQPKPDEFARLESLLKDFAERTPVTVNSADRLARLMAAKAVIIKDEVALALEQDKDKEGDLYGQLTSFKNNLLPNLTEGEFADLYAETITYGMFAARYNDPTIPTFSRAEALELIPATNPFLRALFNHIAGPNLEKRLRYVLDDLVALFLAADPQQLFKNFGQWTARNDPFVHFYEDFLGAYNPKKRKARGVWYTPEPVVDFIVRAVDDVLKSEFGIADGIASTERIEKGPHAGEHKVQILDPATGTGTFLAKVVQMVHAHVMKTAPGAWQGYVEDELIPRLHGFELLMASYTMCHLKLDLMLRETGYKPSADAGRFSVWLTNALEPAEEDIGPLFFSALRREAQGASNVKNKTPIMCVIGNPPYSGESANKGDHIMELMEAYKKEPGGIERLNERNPKWINDDYVKFIRMSEDLIAQNPSGGVLGFITNHGYLDNPTFRGMRWHLLQTFDKIWVLDLHGNTKKNEVSPDGSPDKNVFDIQQGVALIIAARKGKGSKKLAEVWHGDLWGSRKAKTEAIFENGPTELAKQLVSHHQRYFMFYEINHDLLDAYDQGFSTEQFLPHSTTRLSP